MRTIRKPRISPKQPKKEKGIVPIFFTVDDAYAPYMGVAIQSIVENASDTYDYDIVILHQELSPEHRRKLGHLARPGFNLRFVPMAQEIEGIANCSGNKLRQDYFTLTIFFRLFIPEMFPEYDKGIYLDSDVVVPGDIAELYEVDLGDTLVGACNDISIQGVPELVDYTCRGVGVHNTRYVNSGVLLMDLDALRRAGLERRFLELLAAYHFENVAPDQDYLNVLCKDRITYLDPRWDAMPVGRTPDDDDPSPYESEMQDPGIIHYNLFAKPWCYDGIPYAEYFWDFAERSGFADEARACKESYSDDQKASDRRCMAQLVSHAQEIANARFNFRVAFESGLEARL